MVSRFYPPVMASARYANTKKSLLLVTLMILMTQVGYLENLNPWINGEETLDTTDDVMETGGSQNNLTASAEGADLSIDVPMTNITFQYNASAASGSGSGSGASQSSFVNNIGLRSTSGSAAQSTNGSAITPIEFSLEWDNFHHAQ